LFIKSRDCVTDWTAWVWFPSGTGKMFLSSPPCADGFWGPPILLSSGYPGLFPRGWSVRGVKLAGHLVSRLRMHGMHGAIPLLPLV